MADIPVRVVIEAMNQQALLDVARVLHSYGPAGTAAAAALRGVSVASMAFKDIPPVVGLAIGAIGGIAAAAAIAGAAVAVAVTGMVALLAKITVESVRAAASFETSFGNVRKVLGGTEEQLARVREDILKLATTMPVSPDQLAQIAAFGGQLGVGHGQITEFTKTIGYMSVAISNMTWEDAATGVAKFANVMNTSDFGGIASVLVHLGNTSAATEDNILRLSTRIAGAGRELGLSIPSIMGFATSLAQVGVEAHRGGTAAQRVLLAMRDAAVNGGEKLNSLAKIAGVAGDRFQEMIRNNPDEALRLVATGMTTAKDRGIDLVAELAKMNIKGELAKLTFLQLAGSGGRVADAFKNASDAAEKNNVHIEAAERRFQTAERAVGLLLNQIKVAAIQFGSNFLPAITAVMQTLQPLALTLVEATRTSDDLTEAIKTLAVGMTVALAEAFGIVLLAGGQWLKWFVEWRMSLVDGAVGVKLFAAEVLRAFAGIQAALGMTSAAIATERIAANFEAEARKLVQDALKATAGSREMADALTKVGWAALGLEPAVKKAAESTGKLTSATVNGQRVYQAAAAEIGNASKSVDGLGRNNEEAAEKAKKHAEAIRSLADSIGKTDLRKQIDDMAEAVSQLAARGEQLSAEGMKRVAELVAKGLAEGLRIPDNLKWVAAAQLEQDVKELLANVGKDIDLREHFRTIFGAPAEDESLLKMLFPPLEELNRVIDPALGLWTSYADVVDQELENASASAEQHVKDVGIDFEGLADTLGQVADVLDSLDSLFEAFGMSAESSARQAAEALSQVATGAANVAAGIASMNPAQIIQGVADAISGIKKLWESDNKWVRAIGGFLTGGLVGAIIAFGREPAWVRAGKEAGRALGVAVSRELAEAIMEDAERLGISIADAALLSLTEAARDAGVEMSTMSDQIYSLMLRVREGTIPAAEATEALAEAWSALTEEAEKGSLAAQQTMIGMLQLARETGLVTEEMAGYVRELLSQATEGITALIEGAPLVDAESAQAQAHIFSAVFWARVKEEGIVAAATALLPAWQALNKALEEAGLDPAVIEAILGPMRGAFALLENDAARAAANGVGALMKALKGLGDAGYMTIGAFTGIQTEAIRLFNEMVAATGDESAALAAISPLLAEIERQAALYGLEIDEATQALIDHAKEAGVAFPKDPMMQVVDVLKEIAALLRGEIPDAARLTKQAIEDIPKDVNVNVKYNDPGPGGGGGGGGHNNDDDGGDDEPPGFQHGGVVNAPMSGMVAELHGNEVVAPVAALFGGLADMMSAKVAAAVAQVVGGNQNITVVVGGRQLDEVLIERARAGYLPFGNDD